MGPTVVFRRPLALAIKGSMKARGSWPNHSCLHFEPPGDSAVEVCIFENLRTELELKHFRTEPNSLGRSSGIVWEEVREICLRNKQIWPSQRKKFSFFYFKYTLYCLLCSGIIGIQTPRTARKLRKNVRTWGTRAFSDTPLLCGPDAGCSSSKAVAAVRFMFRAGGSSLGILGERGKER
jgi:hypothetical protein